MFMVEQTDWTPNLKKNNILLKYINTFYEYIWISYLTVINSYSFQLKMYTMYVLAVPNRIVHYLCKETFHIGIEI